MSIRQKEKKGVKLLVIICKVSDGPYIVLGRVVIVFDIRKRV